MTAAPALPRHDGGPTPDKQPDQTTVWRDGKRYLWPLSLAVPLFAFVVWGMAAAGGRIFWVVGGPLILYVAVPILDTLIGRDRTNPPEWAVPQLERDRYYRWITYLWIPLQYGVLVWACWLVTSHHFPVWLSIGAGLSLGMISGIAIATAHELGHKRAGVERWLAKIALAQTFYGHFYVEHNRGHHVRVATPEDPASSRLGESLWAFLPRSIVGSLVSGWRLERNRLHAKGYRTLTLRNDILNAWLVSVAIAAALITAFGAAVVPLLTAQAVFGFCLLESINYIEHYGLKRERRDGRYLPATPRHSWNSNNLASNLLLFHLQRHSDHHAYPTRRYQSLRHFDESPQLPSGYAAMLTLAYLPPLWRKVMDPRVIAHYGGDVTKANLQPSKRHRYL